jgi:amino acid permease
LSNARLQFCFSGFQITVVVVAVVLLLTFLDVWLLQVEIRSHFSRKSLSLSKLMAVVTSETHRLLLPLPNGQESSSTSSGPTSSHRFKEEEEEEESVPVLRRHLTLLDGISVLLGIILGSGIFASPGVVLQHTGSVGLGCIAWLAAAFMALCSALVHAELGAAMPQAGGNAYYFKVAFGDAFSFAFIWTMFFVLVNGSLAIVAISSARYFLIGVCNYGLNEVFRI